MHLRALTVKCNVKDYTLSDCPVSVTETLFALSGVKQSPLLRINSIVRGNDDCTIFEGDYVYDESNTLLGYVIYKNGFKLYNLAGVISKISFDEHIYLKKGNGTSIKVVASCKDRTPLLLKYEDTVMQPNVILCLLEDGRVGVSGKTTKHSAIDPKKFQFLALVTCDGASLFFGDIYNGCEVVLDRYEVALRKEESLTYFD